MGNIILLGAKGSLGSQVASLLVERNISFVRVTRDPAEDDGIYWDYKGSVPTEMTNADCIIHCARGPDFQSNISVVKALVKDVSPKTKIILMGSNCVFAKPESPIAQVFFAGDAYILEKRKIEQLAKKRANILLLRPTVVRDEGGWDAFLKSAASAAKVRVPKNCAGSRIKIIDSADVAHEVLRNVLAPNSEPVPEEIYSKVVPLSEFLDSNNVVYDLSDNTYFEDGLKNLLASILCSVFVPFRVKAFLQKKLIKPKRSIDDRSASEYCVDGMTRLYLCGGHTRQ